MESLDECYLQWLYRQVAPIRTKNPARTYWTLLTHLYRKEFKWSVPNDDNRLMDGLELRYEFIHKFEYEKTDYYQQHGEIRSWLERPCSFLEMLLALARRLSFAGGGAASEWFWHMLDNIGLRSHVDAMPGDPEMIDFVLDRVIDRTYDEFGNGGLFPLFHPQHDQRQVELWYQMNCYLLERG